MGIFTRGEAQRPRKRSKAGLPVEYLQQLGVEGVKDMNPDARSPNMQPTGSKEPILYILGEAPGEEEDEKGEQFVGKSGRLLRGLIPGWLEPDVTWDNCCRTRPPKNRTPTPTELEGFRTEVVRSIEERRPQAILAVGSIPLQWAMPGIGKVTTCRGRKFPIQIGNHKCWFYSIHHPSYILRIQYAKTDDIPGEEWRRTFEEDVRRVVNDLDHLTPPPVESTDEANLMAGVTLLEEKSAETLRAIDRFLGRVTALSHLSVDLETACLRAYSKDSSILTVALSNGNETIAFPFEWELDGPDDSWAVSVDKRLQWFTESPALKFAHNLPFEMEWFVSRFGRKTARETPWGCSYIQGFMLDERPGGHSLDFLCRLNFGLPLKSLSKINTGKLQSEPLGRVLRYNALDAKYGHKLSVVQEEALRRLGLYRSYQERFQRVPTAVLSQDIGICTDVKETERLQVEVGKRIVGLVEDIKSREEVALYEKEGHGDFNPTSNTQVATMFRDICGFKEGKRAGNKYCVDKNVLKAIGTPLASDILNLRSAAKMKNTYVDRLHPDAEDSYVFPTGRMHPTVRVVGTKTGRFSYAEPNGQNFPKRNPLVAEVRKQVVPPKGYKIVAVDYGQIEARVLGMASGDEYLCKALWENYDIHLEWAQKVAALWPPTFKKRGEDMKRFRTDIKSELVFAAFYGAKQEHIGGMLELPRHLAKELFEEFWDTFAGVYKWQQKLQKFYQDFGYVEGLTGGRRHGPLSPNMVLNSPIQGTAADLVIDAMVRLSERADRTDDWCYQPILNIHDDLTFYLPIKNLETYMENIIIEMVTMPYDWVNVPIEVEVSVGDNWHEMELVGKFTSADMN